MVAPEHLPVVVCGDFNEMPDSATYSLLTTGRTVVHVPARYAARVAAWAGDTAMAARSDVGSGADTRDVVVTNALGALTSAYASTSDGCEPEFTCATAKFDGTLDYILFTPGFDGDNGSVTATTTQALPPLGFAKRTRGMPNPAWPSDHLALGAVLQMVHTGGRVESGKGGASSATDASRMPRDSSDGDGVNDATPGHGDSRSHHRAQTKRHKRPSGARETSSPHDEAGWGESATGDSGRPGKRARPT